jgi:hypothetical protein
MIQGRPQRLFILAAGFIVWASAFLTLYGVNAIGCAFEWPRPLQRGVLIALLGLHTAALGCWTWYCWRRLQAHDDFIAYVGCGASTAALVAMLLTFAPSFALTLCV